jgi:hypothetical protein
LDGFESTLGYAEGIFLERFSVSGDDDAVVDEETIFFLSIATGIFDAPDLLEFCVDNLTSFI